MLGDGNEHRLVVGGGVDGRELVGASRETVGDVGGEDAVHGGGVQALEECELRRVGGGGLVDCGEQFDDDVGVSNNVTLCVDPLWQRQ